VALTPLPTPSGAVYKERVELYLYSTSEPSWPVLGRALLLLLLTHSTVQRPSWAASQEIPRISRHPKVHYRTHKPPPPVSILGIPEQASRMWVFRNISVLQGGVVSTSSNPQAGEPPLVDCPLLLIQFIRSYPSYRRPFLYPQPEDAPYRSDRDPLHYFCLYFFLSKTLHLFACGQSKIF
jgi:hypothetical protein